MPSFRYMPEAQRLEVIEYVKSLNRRFWERREIKTVAVQAAPPVTPERLTRGKQLYADAECLACHGERGRGDGPSAPRLKDNRDLPIAATDLTRSERFKNGARPEDVYRTLVTGLAGTPMPSYGDSLEPDPKIVKFARPTEAGKTGFVAQPLALSDLKPGWIVSVTTRHEGGNEVAETVTVVMERPQ